MCLVAKNCERAVRGRVLALTLALAAAGYPAPGAARHDPDDQARPPAEVYGAALLDPTQLAAFYADRAHAPVWQLDDAGGSQHAAPTLATLLRAIEDSRLHGLDPEHYHAGRLRQLQAQPDARADLDLLATDAYLRLGLARAHGRLDPAEVDPEWFLHPVETDIPTLLAQLAGGPPVDFVLDALWPLAPEYWALLDEKRRLLTQPTPAGEPIAAGPLLRRGAAGPRTAALRARLGVAGALDDPFDATLEAAVRAFQVAAGLVADGVVGAHTLEMLNLTDADRIRRLDVNLERWRWLMRELPEERVQVDVAAFEMQALAPGLEPLTMKVIVGTPFRRTPVFTERMRYLVFNPDWSVPRRIAVQDKLPLLRQDAAALAAQGYEARRSGSPDPLQPVDRFDWSTVSARTFDFLLRQRPGPGNALGSVKFILPNPHAVYLHDTPARELFGRGGRAFSSGCIRLEHALALAEWVLRDQPQWTRARMDQVIAAGSTQNVSLSRPLPVLILYFTAARTPTGTVVYRPDLYDRDATVAAALSRTP